MTCEEISLRAYTIETTSTSSLNLSHSIRPYKSYTTYNRDHTLVYFIFQPLIIYVSALMKFCIIRSTRVLYFEPYNNKKKYICTLKL